MKILRNEDGVPRRFQLGKAQAIQWLRAITGKDFGDDPVAWEEWLQDNRWAYDVIALARKRKTQPQSPQSN